MTPEQARKELPSVRVKMPNGKTYQGRVTGRLKQFPTISVPYDGKIHSKGHEPWVDFQSTWEQVARHATSEKAIHYHL